MLDALLNEFLNYSTLTCSQAKLVHLYYLFREAGPMRHEGGALYF